ncbi:ABC transporter permease [Blautia sp. RD014234]|nr:ABC transporter permease [Blautia parvula]
MGQISQEAVKAQEEKMGLDKPFLIQYGMWLKKVCYGDLGESFTTGQPVVSELQRRVMPTIMIAFVSLFLTMLISVPLGIGCAVYKDRWLDNMIRSVSFLGISLPTFLRPWSFYGCFVLNYPYFRLSLTQM